MLTRVALALAALLLTACRATPAPIASARPASARPAPAPSAAPAGSDASDRADDAEPDERESPPTEPEAPCTPLPVANAPRLATLHAPPLPGFPKKVSSVTYPSARTGNARVDAQIKGALEGLWRGRRREYAKFLREEGAGARRGIEMGQDITCEATLATRYALSVDCRGLEEFGGAHPTKVDLTLNLELCVEGARPLSLARLFRPRSGYRRALVGAWADALSPEVGESFDPSSCFGEDQDPLAAFALMPRGLRFVTADVAFVCGGLRGDVSVDSFRAFLRTDGPATRIWP